MSPTRDGSCLSPFCVSGTVLDAEYSKETQTLMVFALMELNSRNGTDGHESVPSGSDQAGIGLRVMKQRDRAVAGCPA